MAEISNTTLAVLIVAALVVVVAGSVVNLGGLTGRATSDVGYVNLSIAESLNIQVDPTNNTIDFGTCTPRVASFNCDSSDTIICDGVAQTNCTGDTTSPQFIRVDNVGNVDANVNVTSNCNAAALIGGTSPALNFITNNCNGTNVTAWTTLDATTRNACNNLSYQGGMFRMYANVTIPNNAGLGKTCNNAILTFSAITAP